MKDLSNILETSVDDVNPEVEAGSIRLGEVASTFDTMLDLERAGFMSPQRASEGSTPEPSASEIEPQQTSQPPERPEESIAADASAVIDIASQQEDEMQRLAREAREKIDNLGLAA